MHGGETIFALSSGAGRAGVAVIRVSGPQAFDIVSALVRPLPEMRRASLRTIRHPITQERLDDALVIVSPGPRSFTGEDTVELQCHGSNAVVRAVSRTLNELGARHASPGEFSRRALANGRMDVLDVEALGALLAAETESQRRLAQTGSGRIRAVAQAWRSDILQLRAELEALIDFSDEADVTQRLDSDTERRIARVLSEMDLALASLRNAERVRDGFRVVLMGPPNAGKSSLLNAIAGREVAITSPVPGTTRDTIDVYLDLGGNAVVVTDTAGIRESHDPVEVEGVARSLAKGEIADLVLWLSPVGTLSVAPETRFVSVTTKHDLDGNAASGRGVSAGLRVSSKTGFGIGALLEYLSKRAAETMQLVSEGPTLLTERQAAQLSHARASLAEACRSGATLDMRAEDVRIAGVALDGLVGRIGPEDVLDEIFSRFCIGK
jgi:tRNA modification GTPase